MGILSVLSALFQLRKRSSEQPECYSLKDFGDFYFSFAFFHAFSVSFSSRNRVLHVECPPSRDGPLAGSTSVAS